jgi:hypothetical protein
MSNAAYDFLEHNNDDQWRRLSWEAGEILLVIPCRYLAALPRNSQVSTALSCVITSSTYVKSNWYDCKTLEISDSLQVEVHASN